MKKVLVILYYWPPAGGSAVQRWLKFSKYLREFGWEPIIYAPENAQYPELDPALKQEIPGNLTVLSRKVIEPIQYYSKFLGIRKEGKIGASMTFKSELAGFAKFKHNLAWWVRGNFFIPDAHFLWIKPSVKYLKGFLKDHEVDAIVTTGPPHSIHMIGYKLHRSLQIPWVADFRDPWTSIDFYSGLNLSRFADKKHRSMEASVLHSADHVIAIGSSMKEEFLKLGAKEITVITNGFDEPDISEETIAPESQFSLVHIGTLSASRNSDALWQALSDKIKADPQFSKDLVIRLTGGIDFSVLKSLESFDLQDHVSMIDFLPHKEAMTMLKKAQVLLLLINNSVNSKGIITGKFFEYLAVGRPILLIGPLDGDAAKILEETGGGRIASFEDLAGIRQQIDELYEQYLQHQLNITAKSIEKYSRRELTRKLVQVLDKTQKRLGGSNQDTPLPPVTTSKSIFIIYLNKSTFVKADISILSGFAHVMTYHFARVKTFSGLLFQYFHLLIYLILNIQKIGIIFSWFNDYHTFLPILFGRLFKIKRVIMVGGFDAKSLPELGYGVFRKKNIRSLLARFSYKNASLIAPVDSSLIESVNYYITPEGLKNGIKSFMPDLKTEFMVIPTGYDPDIWRRRSSIERTNSVVSVASIINEKTFQLKGFDLLVRVAESLPDTTFTLIGFSREMYQKYIHSVTPNVILLQFIPNDELIGYYSKAKVYAQFSLTEGLPNSLCEAMLCECIPVGSDVDGIPTVIGDCGILLAQRNVDLAREVIISALSADAELGVRARDRVKQFFSIQKRIDFLGKVVNPSQCSK